MGEVDDIVAARRYADWALCDMLKMGDDPAKIAKLRGRIAGIRAGNLDGAPEVQSALYAIRAQTKVSER